MESHLHGTAQQKLEQINFTFSHIDESNTPVYRDGELVGYDGRKKLKTTNFPYLSDRNGLPLAMSEPQAGNHTDIFEIDDSRAEIMRQLMDAGISTDGLFSNLDAGFDTKELRVALDGHGVISNICPNRRNGCDSSEEHLFDEEMYKERWTVERTNAWMDGFRAVLARFDTTVSSWKGWNYLAFIVIFLKKFHNSK